VLLLARSGNVQDENAEVETPLPHAFPSYTPSTLSRLVDLTPPAFPPLRQDSVPDSFVTIKGRLGCKLASSLPPFSPFHSAWYPDGEIRRVAKSFSEACTCAGLQKRLLGIVRHCFSLVGTNFG